jgi:hypothetical protein
VPITNGSGLNINFGVPPFVGFSFNASQFGRQSVCCKCGDSIIQYFGSIVSESKPRSQ